MRNRHRFPNRVRLIFAAHKVDPNGRGLASVLGDLLSHGIPKGSVEVSGGGMTIRIDLAEAASAWRDMTRPGSHPSTGEGGLPSTTPPEFTHCDGPTLFQHMDPSVEVKTPADAHAWIQPPPNSSGREAVSTAARNLLAQSTLAQDGLKMTTQHPSLQSLFEGGQFISGATLTLPSAELASLLLSHVVITGSPESVHSLSFAQTALAFLAQGPAASSQLSKMMGQLLAGGSFPAAEKMLKTLANLLGNLGLNSFQEVQDLFKGLAEASLASSKGTETIEGQSLTKELSQSVALSSLPQMTGLLEAQGAGLSQTLNQAFGAVFRGMAGLLMSNPQNQWPQALPSDQILSELATLFAAQGKKSEREKKKKKDSKGVFGHRSPSQGWEEEPQGETGESGDPTEPYLEENRLFRPIKPV